MSRTERDRRRRVLVAGIRALSELLERFTRELAELEAKP